MNAIVRWALMVSCALIPNTGLAQVFEGCVVGGTAIPMVASTQINDMAFASIVNGRPVILYRPAALAQLPRAMRNFTFLHECAHHALGHVVHPTFGTMRPLVDEQEADCWAIRTMMRLGMLTDRELSSVQQTFWTRFRGDWMHLPGPQRAINLRECLGAASSSAKAARRRTCYNVTTWVTRVEYVVRTVPQRIPCQHPTRTQWGVRMLHPFDVVYTQQQVPIQRRVPVVRQVCR